MNYRCYQITLQWNIFTQIGRGWKCWLDIYRWGTCLAVTGSIPDTGQKVLQSFFLTGSSSSPVNVTFFPYAFLDETFIRILGIYYIIKIGINDNNAVINNYYGWLQDLTLLFKIPMSRRKDYFKFIDNLGTRHRERFASDVLRKNCPSAVLSVTNLIRTAWDRTRDTFKKQRSFGNRGAQNRRVPSLSFNTLTKHNDSFRSIIRNHGECQIKCDR